MLILCTILFVLVIIAMIRMPSNEEYDRRFKERQEAIKLAKQKERNQVISHERNIIQSQEKLFKPDWKCFQDKLEEVNVHRVFHFTDKSNVASIIANGGILSCHYLDENKIKINKPNSSIQSRENDKLAGLNDYVRLSFTSENPMMYIALRDSRITDPVVLEIDRVLLYKSDTMFSNVNAQSAKGIDGSFNGFCKINFLVFKEQYFDLIPANKKYYLAEVLIRRKIPLKFIKNINKYI